MHRSIPQRLNLFLSLSLIALHLYAFYLLPLSHPGEVTLLGGFLVLTALLTPQLWALTHDAGHGVLFKNRRVNNLFGRIMSLLFGSNFKLLQFGHNVHHGFNRTEVDRTDLFPKESGLLSANLTYYGKIFFALYIGELLMPFLFLLPKALISRLAGMIFLNKSDEHKKVYDQLHATVLTAKNLRTVRIDTLILALHFALLTQLFAGHLYLLGLFVLVRGFMVSFFDNIYHYGTPRDVDYSYNLRLPDPLSHFLLHFNYHQVHHAYPNVSWYNLPKVFEEKTFEFDKRYGKALFNQLRGPIYT